MRVLIVGPDPYSRGGIATLIRNMLQFDQKTVKYKMHVSTSDGSKRLKIFSVPLYSLFFAFRIIFSSYDIIHIHISENMGFYRYVSYVLLSRLCGKKVVVHVHASKFDVFFSSQNKVFKKLIEFTLNQANLIITVGKKWGKVFTGLCKTKVETVFNFITVPDEYCYNPESKKIITTGYIGSRKGYYDLINTLPDILKKNDNLQFVFCGNGEVDRVSEMAEKFGLEQNLTITGWLSNDEVKLMLKESMIFVLPTYNEGMPLAILEAMSYGLPVITTPVGDIPDLVTDPENGILVTPGDLATLEKMILELANDRNRRVEISRRNYFKVKNEYSTSVCMRKIFSLYEQLLN